MTNRIAVGVLLAALAAACGCSQPPPVVPVEGRVTLNGKPLPNAEVRLYPVTKFGGEYIAAGETDADGRFTLVCNNQPGACACANRVTVTEAPLPDEYRGMSGAAQEKAAKYRAGLKNRPIPEQYTTLARSQLTLTVTPDRREYDLELAR